MCGRYTLTYADLSAVVAELDALLDPAAAELYRPRYNVAPTNAAVIARARSSTGGAGGAGGAGHARPALVPAVWGIRRAGRLIINARSESAAARFPEAYQSGRCVVPADGFYEWTGARDDRRPSWFHAPDGAPLFFAGLVDEAAHHGERGAPPAFTVLTTAARAPVAAIHDRMPVLLSAEGARRWLLGAPPRVIQPDDVSLVSRPVSQRVNGTAHDDPACLDAVDAGDEGAERDPRPAKGKQLGLF